MSNSSHSQSRRNAGGDLWHDDASADAAGAGREYAALPGGASPPAPAAPPAAAPHAAPPATPPAAAAAAPPTAAPLCEY